jgi:Xaa-Pro aminopeptidase
MSLRTAALRHDALLRRRLDEVVPVVMRREGIDCWVLVAREYAEDPVVRTMLPATWMSARRRTILAFFDHGAERVAVSRYAVEGLFPGVWDPAAQPDQFARLAEVLAERAPQRIALDVSAGTALADGLTHSQHEALAAALPDHLGRRIVGGELLAVGWLETRLPEEVETMREACRLAHGFLRRALSSEVVEPGRTTTADVDWWLREAVAAAGLDSWFHPTTSVQRAGRALRDSFAAKPGEMVIAPGDLLHIDFGIVAEGLCTDQQQHAYVLRPGESAAPPGLVAALAAGNRLQDLVVGSFATGRTGNEVLARSRAAAAAEGLRAWIYSHPIGLHGHAAGPSIGLWDHQDGVPGDGDLPIHPDTCWSIELMAEVDVPEWGGPVRMMLEEDAVFDGERVSWLDGRQTELWLVG